MVFSHYLGVSRRLEMMLLLSSGVAVNYTLRLNMSVAVPDMKNELLWDENARGLALSSFYWGYAVGQVPFSKLAQVRDSNFKS
jgi:sugar phosphate permease